MMNAHKIAKLINPFFIYHNRQKILLYFKIQIHNFTATYEIPITQNDRKLHALKNRHIGKRGFILGNGPSLKIKDLDKLKGEVTFASNKIYLAFEQTTWRPTYYTVTDILVAKNNYHIIKQLDLKKIFYIDIKKYFSKSADIIWLNNLLDPREYSKNSIVFSTNILKGIHSGYSVIYDQLQLAFYMGIREIYLIGVDFSFNIPKSTGEFCEHGEILQSQGEINHFHPDYRKPGESWTMPRLDMQYQDFLYAHNFLTEHYGNIIYNASRRTKLDVFPQVSFDSLFFK